MKFSLRLKLTLTFLVLIALPLIVLGNYVGRITGRQFRHMSEKSMVAASVATHRYIDDLLLQLTQTGQVAANNESVAAALVAGDRDAMAVAMDRIYGQVLKSTSLNIYEIGDSEGEVIYRVHNPEKYGDDKGDLPLYRQALEGGIVSGIEEGQSGIALRAVVPVTFQGEIIGTVTSGISFTDFLADELTSMTGVAMMIYVKETPEASSLVNRGTGNRVYLPLDDNAVISEAGHHQPGSFGRTQDGDKSFTTYHTALLSSEGGASVILLTLLDMSEFERLRMELLKGQMGIIAVSLLVSVLISYAFIRNIAGPIEQIVSKMHMVEQGIYNVRAVVRRNDEISDLAIGFNNMARVIMESINNLEMENDQLEKRAIKDGLTDCYNKEYITYILEEAVKDAKVFNRSLSILLFDYDHFKVINDSYGHLAGDKVLVQGTALAGQSLREKDSLGRFGGEEFLVVMPDVNEAVALKVATRVKENIQKGSYDEGVKVTVSGGLCTLTDESATELLTKADRLLYKAKEAGRNNIQYRD